MILIANRLNVDLDHLTALNQLTGEAIFPDRVLLVLPTVTPWPETGPFPHIVSQRETLLAIAARFDVTLEEIKALNDLTSDTIFSGQKILIRGRADTAAYPDAHPGTVATGCHHRRIGRRYVITHELTHPVIWNTVGRPSSVMLHEGLAVYTRSEALEAVSFIPLSHFCAAYQQSSQLLPLSESRDYLGHIRDLDLYFASGCFVQYLIQESGLSGFKQFFTSDDYPGIYGRTRSKLEQEWINTLDATGKDLTFEAHLLVASVAQVAD